MRALHRLNPRVAETLKQPGRHADGGNLYLQISENGGRRWIFRYRWNSRYVEMGLGSAAKGQVALAQARELAAQARSLLVAGTDPLSARRQTEASASGLTFGELADAYVDSMESQWRNAKHRAQWRMTLTRYAAKLRPLLPAAIGTDHILAVLKPLWSRTPETAERLRGRLEVVLDAAKARGLRSGENPARWRGHLSLMLPKRQRLTRGHHAALPYAEIAKFMTMLCEQTSSGADALELCILTAARSSEILLARWDEFDLAQRVWRIPAARMKAAREHRVPLSAAAMVVLQRRLHRNGSPYVFPSDRGRRPASAADGPIDRADRPLSSMAMAMTLRRLGRGDITVHGFRSTFRDWIAEETDFPRDLAEQALAHSLKDKTEAAYRRGDAFEKRRRLMDEWAQYCAGVERGTAGSPN